MKKTKILLPILSAAAVAGTVAPILVSCGESVEFTTVDFRWAAEELDVEGPGDLVSKITLDNSSYVKGKDFETTISWSTKQDIRLYAWGLRLVVNGILLTQNTTMYPNGFAITEYGRNCLKVKVPASSMDNTPDGPRKKDQKPVFDVLITVDRSRVDTIRDVNSWENHYFTAGDLWCNALHSDNFEVSEATASDPVTTEFQANLNNWGGGKSLPTNHTLFLGLVDTSDETPKLIPIEDHSSVFLGLRELSTELVDGIISINAPAGGWGNAGYLSSLTTSLNFHENYESVQIVLAETENELVKYNLSATYSTSILFLAEPTIGFDTEYHPKGQDLITQIYWIPNGLTYDHLYAEDITIKVNGKDLLESSEENPNGYSIVGHDRNAVTIKIPAVNFMEGRDVKINLQLENCEIRDNLQLNTYDDDYITVNEQKFDALHSNSIGTSLYRGTYVEFEANLNKWANDDTTLPPDEIYVGLFDVTYPENKIHLPFQEIGRDVYLGQRRLETEIVDGFLVIHAPESGWGKKGNISTLTCYFEVASYHQKAEIILGAPANNY